MKVCLKYDIKKKMHMTKIPAIVDFERLFNFLYSEVHYLVYCLSDFVQFITFFVFTKFGNQSLFV